MAILSRNDDERCVYRSRERRPTYANTAKGRNGFVINNRKEENKRPSFLIFFVRLLTTITRRINIRLNNAPVIISSQNLISFYCRVRTIRFNRSSPCPPPPTPPTIRRGNYYCRNSKTLVENNPLMTKPTGRNISSRIGGANSYNILGTRDGVLDFSKISQLDCR